MITKGQKINDRYEIIKTIGEGGMANVYLARDIILDRPVAVKVLRGDLANDDKFVRRFQREALSASSLSHPNIVEVYDVGEDGGKYYIVMEFVEGRTLKELLKRRGMLTLGEAIDIMIQLSDGLSQAHEAYIIHRDIKPQNILIMENGLVKITDFGIAMAINATGLTQTNSVMGSVHYLPPEQATGKGATIKSDIYSLGILMYELLTGKVPYRGENAVEIALKHMKDQMPSVKKQNENVPQSVENIILKATAKNPKNRYNSVKEMYEDLKTCLNPERLDEGKYVYKYLEHDLDDTKAIETKPKEETHENESDKLVTKIEEFDGDDKKQKRFILVLASIAAVLLLVISFVFLVLPNLNKVKDVKIPDVSGLTVVEAEKKLEKIGLQVETEIIQQESDDIKKGLVIKTEPRSGRTVKQGASVKIYESTGSSDIEIEDYVGSNVYEIKGMLEEKGLHVLVETKNIDDISNYQEDTIIEQNPVGGTTLKKDETITLYIANALVYPDMIGLKWKIQDVEDFANKYKLVLKLLYEETDKQEEGTVLKQSRAEGTNIVEGASLTITIAIAPAKNEGETPPSETPTTP